MKTIQIIELDGRPAALVAGDEAIIPDRITGPDRQRVQAKALYALQISAGEIPGPYSDDGAERFARAAAAPPVTSSSLRRDRRGAHRRPHVR